VIERTTPLAVPSNMMVVTATRRSSSANANRTIAAVHSVTIHAGAVVGIGELHAALFVWVLVCIADG